MAFAAQQWAGWAAPRWRQGRLRLRFLAPSGTRYHPPMLVPARRDFAALGLLALVASLGLGCDADESPPGLDAGSAGFVGALVPSRPADAFDVANIQGATLEDLAWVETGVTTMAGGVRVVDGTWSPGPYTAVTAGGTTTKTIMLASSARLYYPEEAVGPLPLVVFAAHLESLVADDELNRARIVAGLQVALLVHGERNDDPEALGYSTATAGWRGAMTDEGVADVVRRNACGLVDLQTSNFPYVLARTNMLALSLAERLLEQNAQTAGDAALQGGSKEGFATWIAAAVDGRLRLASPGAYQRQDEDSIAAVERNSGCGPNGASSIVEVPAQLSLREWMQATPEGIGASKLFYVSEFVADLLPEFLLLHGDVGMPGMHDGIFFTIGAESSFLRSFSAVPFRFDRWLGPGQPPAEDKDRQLALLAQHLAAPDRAAVVDGWVQVQEASAMDGGPSGIAFMATVASDPDLTHVWLRFSQSPDREFNDADQTPWQSVEMVPASPGSTTFVTAEPLVPPTGYEVAWYVEAEEQLDLGAGVVVARKDASPIELARELPPLHCDAIPLTRCP